MGERPENLQAVRDCGFEARTKVMLAMRKGVAMKDALLSVIQDEHLGCQDVAQALPQRAG